MSAAKSVTANFAPILHQLTVTKVGAGFGAVTSSPAGIDCGLSCSTTFQQGTSVTLTATADPNSVFTGWSGECTGTGTCEVTMSAAKSVTATFAPILHELTVTKAGGGSGTVSSSPAGIDCGPTCEADFQQATVVTLTATPGANSTFTGWSGECTGTGTCEVTMDAARSVTATFAPILHQLSVTKAGTGTGSVSSSPAGIDCGLTCSADFQQATVVTLTAAADPGSVFTGWTGDCLGTGTCEVTMDEAKSVIATFAETKQLTVTKAGAGSGTVTSIPAGIDCGPTCEADYITGTVVTLTAAPGANSTFTGWSGDCNGTGTCQVTMDAARSVTASFAPILHELAVTKTGAGTGTVSSSPAGIDCGPTCEADFQQATVVTLTATPDANSTFTGWSGECTGTGTCEVTMSAAKSVTANFAETKQLTVTRAGAGSGTVSSSPAGIYCGPTCSADYLAGTVITLTANPGPNSTFTGWSGDCTGTGTCQVTMDAARSVTATFALVPHLLTVTKAGTGSGTVTSTPAGINCGPNCATAFPHGMSVTLTITADIGSSFTGWSGDCTGTGTCEVTMNAARRVTATFDSQAPCGNRIAFVSNRTGNTDVFTMNVNGTGATNLTQRSGTDNQPAWSPDCSKIAFSSARGGNTDIYTMNADGSGVQRLTTAGAADTEPTWSPDGTKIAFVSARTGNTEIFTMTSSGGTQSNVSNNASADTAPDWSPDGVKIAFTSARSGSKQVFKMNASGTNVVRLTTGLGACDFPAWSPDGAKLAFTSKLSGTAQVSVMNADGTGAIRLSTSGAVDSHPSWSPTGAKIAFSSTQTGVGQIFTMNANGTSVTNISANASAETGPAWSS
jgi:Tol biopolymer transport system component